MGVIEVEMLEIVEVLVEEVEEDTVLSSETAMTYVERKGEEEWEEVEEGEEEEEEEGEEGAEGKDLAKVIYQKKDLV